MNWTRTDVNPMFDELVASLNRKEIEVESEQSRNGQCYRLPGVPVLNYTEPWKRVLFNPHRDCNPFFHLYEAMWMLAGQNLVAPLRYYNSRMGQYSDDDLLLNGAYGYRWRCAESQGERVDQLDILRAHMKAMPNTRRAVLSMWNVNDDLMKVNNSSDVCCNLNAVFYTRWGECPHCEGTGYLLYDDVQMDCQHCATYEPKWAPRSLDMTVFNRSNDLIWGSLGANYVHFTFLQEWMALALGLRMGVYSQVSSNLHYYEVNWKPDHWLQKEKNRDAHSPPLNYQQLGRRFKYIPLYNNVKVFNSEVEQFWHINNGDKHWAEIPQSYQSPFLKQVAHPVVMAFHCRKVKDISGSLKWCEQIGQADWRVACKGWIERRQ